MATAEAQLSGRLSGSVADPAGAAIAGARVSLLLAGGATAVLATTTGPDGHFDFTAVRPDTYRLLIEYPGFLRYAQQTVKVDAARETALPTIRLELAGTSASIEVAGDMQHLDTATAEVSTTVSQEQIRNLPVLDRQITNLFVTQAGVNQNTRTATVINGMRPTYSNVTIDGIAAQDSVRLNNLDNLPNRLTIAQVAEFTVSTSNANPTVGGSASTVMLSTPSGGNQMHGSLYWYNRNRALSANDWFNNQSGIERPALNLNQAGGTLGGAIIRDRLFYFGNYEAFRQNQQSPVTRTILTPTARQGILQYQTSGGLQQFDVLKASGLTTNPAISALLAQVPTTGNTTTVGDGLNTTGFTSNARSNDMRNNVLGKGDFNLSQKHVFSLSYLWNSQMTDRTSYTPYYTTVPPVYNDTRATLISGSWRWTPRADLTNELRAGFNRSFVPFLNRQTAPAYFLSGTLFSSPLVSSELTEQRHVNTYILQNNASWMHGRHGVQFGFQMNRLGTQSVNANGSIPIFNIGISTASSYGFTTSSIPGASSTNVTVANNLLATLAGLVSSGSQTFNVNSKSSGFVRGAPSLSSLAYNQYAGYLVDTYKLRRNLTLTLGLRYDLMAPVQERNSLAIQPTLINNDPVATLLGNATLNLAGDSGHPFYATDRNNFAPNVSVAWDVFGDGKTSVRGGFNVAFLNDNTLNSVYNTYANNSGLTSSISVSNLTARADAPPTIPTPAFSIPTTTRAQYNLSPTSPPTQALVDPNLATPYAEQWNIGIQREVKGFILEGRYVANHVVKMYRGIDVNQIDPKQGGFLDDFIRARNNGFLSLAAGKGFSPAYNAAVAGSQPLTVLPSFYNGGMLTNSTIQSYLRTGEAGQLAQTYQWNGLTPDGLSFFPNPLAAYSMLLNNVSNSSYNGLQVEARKRTRHVQFQANYTFSKALTDAFSLRGWDAQLDNNNRRLERARADFDLTHSFKLNYFVPIPVGAGHRLNSSNPVLGTLLTGWATGGFAMIQSGNPVSILSGRGTLNRTARSGQNTVDTSLTLSQLKARTGVFMTGDGPYWFDPKNINSDGRAVASDGAASFDGQVFFQPQPGKLGSLQRRMLDGPGWKSFDVTVIKETKIREHHTIELQVGLFNLLNHPNFYITDQTVSSSSFGRIGDQNYSNAGVGPRVIQFGLYYKF
jgi:hypothetical protein